MISRIIDFSIRRRWVVVTLGVIAAALGAYVADPAPDRRGARHHQQAGADQHHRAGAVAGRDREADHLSASRRRWPARRASKARARCRATASRRSRRSSPSKHRHLFRAPADQRTPAEVRARLPQGIEPQDRSDFDRSRRNLHVDGRIFGRPPQAGRARRHAGLASATAAYLTPEGQCSTSEVERHAYLRTVQDWIIRPQIKGVPGVAGVDAIGGYRQAIPGAARTLRN